METGRVLDCLAASYRLDLDESSYVRHLADEAEALLDAGLGVLAYTYDARDPKRPIVDQFAISKRFNPTWLRPFYDAVVQATNDVDGGRRPVGFGAWGHMTCGQASRIDAMRPLIPLFAHLGGAQDTFAVNALDASGKGLWLGALLPTTAHVPATRVTLLSRFAAHLTAAVRLRRETRTKKRNVAAVMSPHGKLLHAEQDESIVASREELRAATVDFDRARSKKMRADVDRATRRWRPLVSSRWSLLDDFDTDGRRFVVAVENRPPTRTLTTKLSEREQQVVTHALLGRTNKEIAYELGLSASTVRAPRRAATKVGVATREELIAHFDSTTSTPGD